MQWFGKSYGAAYEDDCEHVPTPVGAACGHCDEPIAEADSGVVMPCIGAAGRSMMPMHYECHVRGIVGGVNHQTGHCFCCGGDQPPDPPELTKREAAIRAVEMFAGYRDFITRVRAKRAKP